jgi:hypothetical protein
LFAFAVQLCPSGYFGVQVPLRQKLLAAQSASRTQAPVLQAEEEAQALDPGHALAAPGVQMWVVLHDLLVSIEVAESQEAVPQSAPMSAL